MSDSLNFDAPSFTPGTLSGSPGLWAAPSACGPAHASALFAAPSPGATPSRSPAVVVAAQRLAAQARSRAFSAPANVTEDESDDSPALPAGAVASAAPPKFVPKPPRRFSSEMAAQQQQQQQQAGQQNQSLYKTELCRSFQETGTCRYGSKCQFAHGKEELRQVSRHPRYKTEICKTFHTIGTCRYGTRCRFIHMKPEEYEQYQQQQQQQAAQTASGGGAAAQPAAPLPVSSNTITLGQQQQQPLQQSASPKHMAPSTTPPMNITQSAPSSPLIGVAGSPAYPSSPALLMSPLAHQVQMQHMRHAMTASGSPSLPAPLSVPDFQVFQARMDSGVKSPQSIAPPPLPPSPVPQSQLAGYPVPQGQLAGFPVPATVSPGLPSSPDRPMSLPRRSRLAVFRDLTTP
eukprot:m51a1_g2334 putative zinc finger (403) ;mRNA; f:532778-534319